MQTKEMVRSLPTYGMDLAAMMPFDDLFSRNYWILSVRKHHVSWVRGEKRSLMAIRLR